MLRHKQGACLSRSTNLWVTAPKTGHRRKRGKIWGCGRWRGKGRREEGMVQRAQRLTGQGRQRQDGQG